MSQYSPESREIELEAVGRVQRYYSEEYTVRDLGKGDGYDFEIHHVKKGLVGIGEVSWLEDPIKKSAWSALLKQKEHHIIPLNTGQGFWSMSIKHSGNINRITKILPNLIALLIKAGETERQIYESWPHDDISKSLRDLGIDYLRKVDDSKFAKDQCFFLLEGSGGLIPESLEPLADFILKLLYTEFSDCLRKLNRSGDLERHLYFRMGSYLPFNLTDPLGFHNPEVKIGKFNFPPGISHVWLIGSNENYRNVLWSNDTKFSTGYI